MISFDHLIDSTSEEDSDDDFSETKVFINHIRKCFITIDDNSYCEQGILPDLRIFNGKTSENRLNSSEPDSNFLESVLKKRIETDAYEYVRINKTRENRNYQYNQTPKLLQRIDSYSLDKSVDKIKTESPKDIINEIVPTSSNIFECKKAPTNEKNHSIMSPLTQLLTQSNESNEFLNYSKFEAHIQDPNQVQTFRIFLPMCDLIEKNNEKKNFMQISIYKNSRISDLIGLICCKYINEKRKPSLKYKNVNDYNLKIADDDGDIEQELTPLEHTQRVGRFGFNDLALIEKSGSQPSSPLLNSGMSEQTSSKKISVTINFTDDSPQKTLEFDTDNILMEKVFEELLQYKMESSNIFCPRILYRLEHIDQIGVPINLETAYLHDFKKNYEFFFFRENSVRKKSSPRSSISFQTADSKPDVTRTINENSEFDVTYLSKWRRVPFKIELSKDNFELEEIKPVQISTLRLSTKRSNFYTIPMKNVVSCSDLNELNGLCQIRIIVAEEELDGSQIFSYKHLDFECEPKVADSLKTTFSHLIMFCNSPIWKQYQSLRKKSTTKWSRRLYKEKANLKTS